MTKGPKKTVAFLFCLFFLSSKMCGEISSYLDFETGYRWDKVTYLTTISGPGFPGLVLNSVTQKKNVQSWQVGGRGRWAFCNLYVRGSGHYGWLFDGDYHDTFINGDLDGNVWDASVGVGYYFCFHPCWGLAPVVGWSRDEWRLKNKPSPFVFNGPLPNLNFKSRLNSAWFGLDLLFQPKTCWDIAFSYELHRGWWKSKVNPSGSVPDVLPLVLQIKDDHMWGNLFRVEGSRQFCGCFLIGLNLAYQTWWNQAKGKILSPSLPRGADTAVVDELFWDNFTLNFQLGYRF